MLEYRLLHLLSDLHQPLVSSAGEESSLSPGLESVCIFTQRQTPPPSVIIYLHPSWPSSYSICDPLSLFPLPLSSLSLYKLCLSLSLPLTLPHPHTSAPSVLYCNSICGQSARGFGVLLITDFTAAGPHWEARHLQHLPISCLSWADINRHLQCRWKGLWESRKESER